MAKKKASKSEAIRELLKQGMDRNDIVKKLNVSPQLVYIVWRNSSGKKSSKKPVKAVKAAPVKLKLTEREELVKVTALHLLQFFDAYNRLVSPRFK